MPGHTCSSSGLILTVLTQPLVTPNGPRHRHRVTDLTSLNYHPRCRGATPLAILRAAISFRYLACSYRSAHLCFELLALILFIYSPYQPLHCNFKTPRACPAKVVAEIFNYHVTETYSLTVRTLAYGYTLEMPRSARHRLPSSLLSKASSVSEYTSLTGTLLIRCLPRVEVCPP